MEWLILPHCCYRGQRNHVLAAGIVKTGGHGFHRCFGGLQEGTFLTVHVKQQIPGRSQSLKWKLSSMPALSGITREAESFIKALPPLGSELAGLRICCSCWYQPILQAAVGGVWEITHVPLVALWALCGEASGNLQAMALATGGRSGRDCLGDSETHLPTTFIRNF